VRQEWLRRRLAESPGPLRERLERWIRDVDAEPGDLPGALVSAACEILESVRDSIETREAAFDLLTADGLLTLACEAAAYADPEGLAERCRDLGPSGELGRVAERWVGRN
jgi:hypothetical protein